MEGLLYEHEVLDAYTSSLKWATHADLALALVNEHGLSLLRESTDDLLERGGSMRILVGVDLPTPPAVFERLLGLQRRHSGRVVVRRFQSPKRRIFHPKMAVFLREGGSRIAIVGSANLTSGGLEGNYEASVLVDHPAVVEKLAEFFEELFEGGRSHTVTGQWLDRYRGYWDKRKMVDRTLRRLRDRALSPRDGRGQPTKPERIRGVRFAFTGRIPDWPREARLYPTIVRLGGSIAKGHKSVPGADFLVHADILGDRQSTLKLRAARRCGVPIITEDQFLSAYEGEQRRRHRHT